MSTGTDRNVTPKIYSKRKYADRAPTDAVYVGRPSPWENPFVMRRESERALACDYFETLASEKLAEDPHWLDPLRGKDLVCWCQSPSDKKPKRCHAETLMRLANRE